MARELHVLKTQEEVVHPVPFYMVPDYVNMDIILCELIRELSMRFQQIAPCHLLVSLTVRVQQRERM